MTIAAIWRLTFALWCVGAWGCSPPASGTPEPSQLSVQKPSVWDRSLQCRQYADGIFSRLERMRSGNQMRPTDITNNYSSEDEVCYVRVLMYDEPALPGTPRWFWILYDGITQQKVAKLAQQPPGTFEPNQGCWISSRDYVFKGDNDRCREVEQFVKSKMGE